MPKCECHPALALIQRSAGSALGRALNVGVRKFCESPLSCGFKQLQIRSCLVWLVP